MAGTIEINGTGGIIEGNLGAADVDVNLDKALIFDGTDDYITCGTDTDHDFTNNFTLACWAKHDDASASGNDHLIAKYSSSGNTRCYRLSVDGSDVKFTVGYNSGASHITIESPDSTIVNTWRHYAATFASGVMKLYVDGVLVTSTDNSGTLTAIHSANSRALEIGSYSGGGNNWKGNIADVRIYNAVLGQTDIQLLASKINTDKSLGAGTTNLKGYWKLNGEAADGGAIGSGTGFVPDESGTVNQGDLENFTGTYWDYDAYSVDVYDGYDGSDATTRTTTDGDFTVTQGKVEGKALTSLHFHDDNDHVLTADSTLNSIGAGDWTVSAWVTKDLTHNGKIVAKVEGSWGDGNQGFSLEWTSGDKIRFEMAGVYLDSATAFDSDDTWYHIVAARNGNTGFKLWVNGVLDASGLTGGTLTSSKTLNDSTPLAIGKYGTHGNYYNGKIRNVQVYDYQLSNEQVASLYSNTYLQTPLHWWKLDDSIQGTATTTAIDSGTGTTANGTLTDFEATDGTYAGSGWNNGTLDLDGEITIATNGSLSAPRGNLDLSANLNVNGTFSHNNGKVRAMDTTTVQIQKDGNSTPLTFYNLEANTGWNSLRGVGGITVLNILSATTRYNIIRPLDGNVSLTLGTTSSAGALTGNAIQFTSNGTNYAEIKAASSLYPWTAATAPDFDSGGSGSKVKIADCDLDPDITTGGGGVTITLDGDCEFDAVTVSTGDKLDLNGQRAVMSGLVTLSGDNGLKDTAGGAFLITNGIAPATSTQDSSTSTITYIADGGSNSHKVQHFAFERFVSTRSGNIDFGRHAPNSSTMDVIAANSGSLSNWGKNGSNDTNNMKNLTIVTGTTAVPESSTLTVAGDFTTSGGLLGASCLNLDRDNTEYARGVSHADLDLFNGRNAMTAEMWFKTSYTGSNHQHMMNLKDNDGNPQVMQMFIDYSTGKVNARVYTTGTTSTLTSAGDVRDGKWHHVAIVYDGDYSAHATIPAHKLYIDGKLEAEELSSGAIYAATNAEFNIGVRYSLDQGYFHGNIDEVRLFAAAKTDAQIRADMFVAEGTNLTHFNSQANGSTDGLVGRFGCNEGTGSTLSCSNTGLNMTIKDYAESQTVDDAWAGAGTFAHTVSMADASSTSTNYNASTKLIMSGAGTSLNYISGEVLPHLNITNTSGTITANAISGTNNLTVASLTTEGGSSEFTAPAGTLTITSENSDGMAFELGAYNSPDPSTYKHGNGTVTINNHSAPAIHAVLVSGQSTATDGLYNVIIDGANTKASTYSGTNAIYIYNNFTVTNGNFKSNGATNTFTVLGNVSLNGGNMFNSGNAPTGAHTYGSLTIADGTTYKATNGTTTITSEGDGSGGTNGYALMAGTGATLTHNGGTFSIDTDATTVIYVQSATNTFNDLIINNDGNRTQWDGSLTILGDLTINASDTFQADGADNGLTVDGDVLVSGTLGYASMAWAGAASFGSLTIADGGTYLATSGTTTITGETASHAWKNDESDGTGFVHNNGKVKIYDATGTVMGSTSVKENVFYDLEISLYATTYSCSLYDGDGSDAVTILNNLDVTKGEVEFSTISDTITIHGLTNITADAKFSDNAGHDTNKIIHNGLVTNLGTYNINDGTTVKLNGGIRQLGTLTVK